ncbi:MAG: PPOX class F420-dependent oxidoreductase [Thermomicrobiales bacterium]
MTATVPETIIPASHIDLLTAPGFGHLATVGPGGAPQVNPVGYLWTGEQVLISVEATTQKLRNIRREPRVAISFLDSRNPARYLEIRGEVRAITPDVDDALRSALLQRYLRDGQTVTPPPPGERFTLAITPLRVTKHG